MSIRDFRYIESSVPQLKRVNDLLKSDANLAAQLIQWVRIGLQERCQVTDDPPGRDVLVTQTYNSAISIGYSKLGESSWRQVARVVLDGTYEATLLVGVLETLRALREGRSIPPVLLTMVGGGEFKNRHTWIVSAIKRAITLMASKYPNVPLDVRIVHFRSVDRTYQKKLEGTYPSAHTNDGDGDDKEKPAVSKTKTAQAPNDNGGKGENDAGAANTAEKVSMG